MHIIRYLISIAVLLTTIVAQAASIMNIVPSTTTVTVPTGSSASVSYTVTNNTASATLTKLTITPAAGGGIASSMSLSSDTCTGSNLVPAASCTFNLVIQSANQPSSFTLSPRVCADNNTVCSQAIASNRPTVTVGGTTKQSNAYISLTNDTVQPINDVTQALGTPYTGFDFGGQFFVGTTISPDGNTLYVSDSNSNNIQIIDLTGANPPVFVTVPPAPGGIAVLPDGSKVYVACVSGSVAVVDTTTLIVSTISYGFHTPYAVTVSPDGTKLYVDDFVNPSNIIVEVFDTSNDTVINSFPGLAGTPGVALPLTAVSPDNATVVTSSPPDDAIAIFDATLNLLGPVFLPPSSSPAVVLFSQDGTRLYISLNGVSGGAVAVYDNTFSPITTINGVGNIVGAMSLDPSGKHLYVVPQGETYITVIDTTNFSTTQINIPTNPLNMGVNPFVG